MATIDSTRGISIDVEELIAVRNRLGGLSSSINWRRLGTRSGTREIRLRGRGMDYEESRAYVYGDDVRTMDWRVMARTGEAHSKVFAEEKERACLIAVDLSASMFFGTRYAFKSWAAAQVAAHVGWLASFAGERIGGVIASPEYHGEVRPGKTRSGLLAVFHHLARAAQLQPPGQDDSNRLNYLLDEVNRVATPGTDILLISDLMGADRLSHRALSKMSQHNQVYLYWIFDDSEVEAWPVGDYPIQNRQGNLQSSLQSSLPGNLQLNLGNPDHRRWLSDRQQDHQYQVESLCAGFNIPLLPISANRDITSQILQRLQTAP